MASKLSLKKINSLWQYSASTAEASGDGVALSDTLSCIDFDEDGRAFFYILRTPGGSWMIRFRLRRISPFVGM